METPPPQRHCWQPEKGTGRNFRKFGSGESEGKKTDGIRNLGRKK